MLKGSANGAFKHFFSLLWIIFMCNQELNQQSCCCNSSQSPEVVILYCQHALSEDAKAIDFQQQAVDFSVRAIMMPCSSKIEAPYILRILEDGADAVEIVACPEKACKFLIGSSRAEKRVEYVRELLEKIGYGRQMVGISRKLSQSPQQLIDIASARAQAVRPLGKNPMKKGEQK